MTGMMKNPPQRLLDRYKCTKEEWLKLRDLGLQMVLDGVCKKDSTPLRAYQHQQTAAERRRGIIWKLSLMEWWQVWEESGRWNERGVGRGWQMCRKGDQGAYEIGNVYIGPGADNLSAAAKATDLPIGVAYVAKGTTKPYRAYCHVLGRQRHIGLFETADEAEQAYLKAVALDKQLKKLADAEFQALKSQLQGKPRSVVARNAENAAKALASRTRSVDWRARRASILEFIRRAEGGR